MFNTVVWLAGMPRSGTSLLSQIFDSHPNVDFKLSPLFSYKFKNKVDINSTKIEWDEFFRQVYKDNDDFINQTSKRKSGEYPTFQDKNMEAEFLVIKYTRYHNLICRLIDLFKNIKIIYIVRHPAGCINSWINTPGEFPQDKDPMREWKTGKCRKTGKEEFWGFDDWKKLGILYINLEKQYPDNVKIVQYESLIDHPSNIVKDLFYFTRLKYHNQTHNFIKSMNTKHIENEYAVYKKKSVKDKWKYQLDKIIIEQILEEVEGTILERFLYQ